MTGDAGPAGRATGVLVLRAWVESGGALRVRVARTPDVELLEPQEASAASPERVVALVAEWLEQVRRRGGDSGVTQP